MRPICFFTLLTFSLPVILLAQNPVALSLRTAGWISRDKPADGIGWSAFSRQYYSLSNWNLTGMALTYTRGSGQSAVMACRDGVSSFSWYNLHLSHYQKFKMLSGILQLRCSWINLDDRPLIFRIGGNILTSWSMSETLVLEATILDFQDWLLPLADVARGDPVMRFLLFHDPGRLIGLVTGFRISRTAFGPVTSGIRFNLNDKVSLSALIDVLPLGIMLGISYQLTGCRLNVQLEQRTGLGLTPTLIIGNE
jgi:hypothetical protein